jgi:hypothetical protein
MNTSAKKTFRKRRLFPRSLKEAVSAATKPLMDKQGKLYSALLRDWNQIVGPYALVSRPDRLQFPAHDGKGATLYLSVRPAAAPELAYATEQLLEQCARYFGYRAIERIVLHQSHGTFDSNPVPQAVEKETSRKSAALPAYVPTEMRSVLERLAIHVTSASDKKK